jgi:simple sugar transport system ATP-binding protein
LGADPRILLMDEPTAALGVREAAAFLDVAMALKEHGISVILVSHRIPDLLTIGDRIVVLKGGVVQGVLETKSCELDDVVRLIVGGRAGTTTRDRGPH